MVRLSEVNVGLFQVREGSSVIQLKYFARMHGFLQKYNNNNKIFKHNNVIFYQRNSIL